jgi:hypothetical protein
MSCNSPTACENWGHTFAFPAELLFIQAWRGFHLISQFVIIHLSVHLVVLYCCCAWQPFQNLS